MSQRFVRRYLPALALIVLSAAPALAQNGPYRFYPLTPCRLVDTRSTEAPIMAHGTTRNFQVRGKCGVPTDAKAAALNVTAFTPTGNGHLRVFPSGTALPNVSTLNFQASSVIANGAIVSLSTAAQDLAIYAYLGNGGNTHVIVDITGYFATPAP